MTFDLDQGESRLPSSITFQIPITIKNIIIHQCFVDEGAYTCVMSTRFGKYLDPLFNTIYNYPLHL